MNYLNDPHYDLNEAKLDHFDQSAANRPADDVQLHAGRR